MRLRTAASLPYYVVVAAAQLARAQRRGLEGAPFGWFGFGLGLRLLPVAPRAGIELLLNPVSMVRYVEFPFAYRHLRTGEILDVSSPRLLSLYVASKHPDARIRVLNPDARDLERTRTIAKRKRVDGRLQLELAGVDAVFGERDRYDAIYAVSVVEHIAGAYDERTALAQLWPAVKPGGRLILTVPADRTFRTESREQNLYGTAAPDAEGAFFFQRFYDENAVRERLIEPVGVEPAVVEWYGEDVPGQFDEWEQRVMQRGSLARFVDDPMLAAQRWRRYPDWAAMPGIGVCCLVFEKPAA